MKRRVWSGLLVTSLVAAATTAFALQSVDDPFNAATSPEEVEAVGVRVLEESAPPAQTQAALGANTAVTEAGIDPSSLRLSQQLGPAASLWVGRKGSEMCLALIDGKYGTVTCNKASVISSFGSIPLTTDDASGTYFVTGLVADGAANARMGTSTVPVVGNTFAFRVKALSEVRDVTVDGPTPRALRYGALIPAELK